MNSISAVGGVSLKASEIATLYNAKVLALQKDAVRMQGEMAVRLIQSATATQPVSSGMDTGRILNVTA